MDKKIDSMSDQNIPILLEVQKDTKIEKPSYLTIHSCKIRPKCCLVCGTETSCYHYDIASCHGCKTFFRRSLIAIICKKMKIDNICNLNGQCNIKQGSRCRACRFNACLLAGMNPAALKFPKSVNLKQIITDIENRRKDLHESQEVCTIFSKVQPKFIELSFCKDIDDLLYLELKVKNLRESTYNPAWRYTEFCEILNAQSILSDADKYSKPPNWPLDSEELTLKFADVNSINKFMQEDQDSPTKRHWLTIDFILSLEMAKILPIYQNINENDKIILLKQVGFVNAVLTQSFYSFQNNSNTLLLPDGFMPLKILFNVIKEWQIQQPSKLYIDTFHRSIETLHRIGINPTEYVLLKAVIFCYPAIQGLSKEAQRLLLKQQEIYARILLRHLQTRHGNIAGAKKYSDVIALIGTFFYFAECHKQFHILPSIEIGQKELLHIEKLRGPYIKSLPPIFEKILL